MDHGGLTDMNASYPGKSHVRDYRNELLLLSLKCYSKDYFFQFATFLNEFPVQGLHSVRGSPSVLSQGLLCYIDTKSNESLDPVPG